MGWASDISLTHIHRHVLWSGNVSSCHDATHARGFAATDLVYVLELRNCAWNANKLLLSEVQGLQAGHAIIKSLQ